MPLTLAVDCALRRINLAASAGKIEEKPIGGLSLDVGTRQSELLPSAVGFFLESAGYSVLDISLIAVTTGPGYYTGIRVGMAYASALSESLGIKIVPVPTLEAMARATLEAAEACGVRAPVSPVIPAGRNSVYAAVYSGRPASAETVMAPSYMDAADFMDFVYSMGGGEPIFVGYDISPVASRLDGRRFIAPSSVGASMIKIARTTESVDPADIRASYLRSPV